MRSRKEIVDLRDKLNDNIIEHGWDALIEGAYVALGWVLGNHPDREDAAIARLLARPENERRRDWIHLGGNPNEWDIEAHRTEEP